MPRGLIASVAVCGFALCILTYELITWDDRGMTSLRAQAQPDTPSKTSKLMSSEKYSMGTPPAVVSETVSSPLLTPRSTDSASVALSAGDQSPNSTIAHAEAPPAVFANPDYWQSIQDPQIREGLAVLAEEFVQEVNGSGITTSDPRYREIWVKARERADDQIRLQYGQRFLNELR